MLDKNMNPAQMEADIYAKWEQDNLFEANLARNQASEPYTIVIPPPNVTGSLHIGHALNNSIQDVLIRWQRMKGKDALWVPGTDHAGIATQMVVERKLAELGGLSRKQLGREAFLDKVWAWKKESGGQITTQLRRLGASCDWSRERFTLDEGLSIAVRKVFVDLFDQGLIYRDQKLVNWDPAFETAISDLEVKPQEVKGNLWHIKYAIKDSPDEFIIVATTRPETLFGDMAVAVHPDDPRYQNLIGKFCHLPLTTRLIPIIADSYADPEQGSGAVKITPAHDFNDFEVGKRHNLTLLNILTPNAHLNENVPQDYIGMERFAARAAVVKALEELGLIEKIEKIKHTVPYGDRGGVPVEPYLTTQWYVDAQTLAKPAIAAVREGKTKFVPENWSKTYYNWMENIQPWCISRQLWWGHRIPAWFGPDEQIFVAMDEDSAYAKAKAYYATHNPSLMAELEQGRGLNQDSDVLDTWFSSALWPFSTLGWPEETPDMAKFYPNSVLVTAFDIIFFWVARMMMMGIHFTGEVPFHTVIVHALVLDADGKKMSKSKGNVIDPLASIDDYGADALRFALLSQAGGGRNVRISDDLVKTNRNFITKIWNAARFCEMNEIKIPSNFNSLSVKGTTARWLVSEIEMTRAKLDKSLGDYRFGDAAMELYHFIWGSFCDWHLEFAKPILLSSNQAAVQEIKSVTGWAFGEILKLFHPFCPFVSEALWLELQENQSEKTASLMRTAWPLPLEIEGFKKDWQQMDWMRNLITTIRGVRSELNVPASLKVKLYAGSISDSAKEILHREAELVSRLARLDSISNDPAEAGKGIALLQVGGERFALPLLGLIDFEAEHDRLLKDKEKVANVLMGLQAKLDNSEFIAKAPEEVITDIEERKAEAILRLNDINITLQILGS